MIPSDSVLGRFDFTARRSILSHQETNPTSLFFFACLHFQCWTNTIYTTLTSRAIKKQLCVPVRFHYACLLPYRWQYRYVTTVLPAFARNVFYGGRTKRFLMIMMASDIRGWMGPSFRDICLTAETKTRKKPQSGNLTRPRIEPGPAM